MKLFYKKIYIYSASLIIFVKAVKLLAVMVVSNVDAGGRVLLLDHIILLLLRSDCFLREVEGFEVFASVAVAAVY